MKNKTFAVAKLTRYLVRDGFYRVSSDDDKVEEGKVGVRIFSRLKVLVPEGEKPVLVDLTPAQVEEGAKLEATVREQGGDLSDFRAPVKAIRFKRAMLLTGTANNPELLSYPEGLALYVSDPTLESKPVRQLPLVLVQAALSDEDIASDEAEPDAATAMFWLKLGLRMSGVDLGLEDDDEPAKADRFEGVPVVGDPDREPEAYAKIQALIVEGDMAMIDPVSGGAEVRVYGKLPIFVEPGATYTVEDLTEEQRERFKGMVDGKFEFTKGVIFNGTSAMQEELGDGRCGFAFGQLRGLVTPGTTISRHEAWLPKDVVESGGFAFDDEIPAPLPESLEGPQRKVEDTVTL